MKAGFSLSAALFALGCISEELTPEKTEADVTTESLRNILESLDKIGKDNGGTRAFGRPGYQASVDYVLSYATGKFGDAMDTVVQPFNLTYAETRNLTVIGPDGKEVFAQPAQYGPATPLPGGITAPLVDTPVDDENGSGCSPEDWEGIDAEGKIALVKRGVCYFSQKLLNAKKAGAVGVLVYNYDPGENYTAATLQPGNRTEVVPMALIPLEVGLDWKDRLAKGEELVATLIVDSLMEDRVTWNVIAETKEGDPDNVVMMGAHLDSVPEGPGINDDGSGTAALLEIMSSFQKYTGFKNKVRFGWWGAEEEGLVGSIFYTGHLTPEEADKIRFYFNYDMIGSIEPAYIVYDGEPTGTNMLVDYLKEAGKPAEIRPFGSSSDYYGFLRLGIPSSGIFTGAGDPEDPCYHQACDNITNINWDAMTVNTKAAANIAAKLALSLEGIPMRNASKAINKPEDTPERKRSLETLFSQARTAKKHHSYY